MNAFTIGRTLADLHPILVHFPIVLWPASLVVDLAAVVRARKEEAPPQPQEPTLAGRWLLTAGTVIALLAFLCGIYAETVAARAGQPTEPMETHEFAAIATTWWFIALTVLRLFFEPRADRYGAAWLLGLTYGCASLVYTGYLGGQAVYGSGVGVGNVHHLFTATPEDLGILAMQQPLKGILYSDWMHHIFGWLVLGISILVALGGDKARKHGWLQRLIPLALLAGGAFLWVYSDWDSWPLSTELPITDKEVLLHKVIATLLLVFGLALARSRRQLAVELDSSTERRVLAVFGIIGGALMLTHIHSVAPYSNVALGVYIHHSVLGGLALAMGGVQLATSSVPRLKAAMPALMAALALVLITYNEGLPWYLGYVAHPLPGPLHGQVAQLGALRAELTFERSSGRIEIHLWNLHDDKPASAALSRVRLLIEQSGTRTLLPLKELPASPMHSAWVARADFLRTAPSFLPRLLASDEAGQARSADFDPWVAPVLAWFDPNGRPAPYVCSMHPQEGARQASACRICGMRLVPNPIGASQPQAVDLELASTPRSLSSATPCRLELLPRDRRTGKPCELAIVHEKPLHLMIVSKDLSFFDHVHPEPEDNGSLTLDYSFRHGGDYVLFAELTPLDGVMQSFRMPLTVDGPPAPPQVLRTREAEAIVVGRAHVTMRTQPPVPRHGQETVVRFTLRDGNADITDLEPFLGARGHLAAIDSATRRLLHSHPVEEVADHFGPDVCFHVKFPEAGLYKLWGQFMRHGAPVTAPFVVRVD